MATYVNDLRLKEIATGDEAGTWGTSTNTNLELIAEAFSFGTEAITTNADTHTTTIADGSTDPGRSLFLKYTGTLDSTCTITIGPNTVSKLWFIENATSGSQSIIIKQGSGATITIANGQTKAIYSDGAGSGAAMVDAFTDLSVPSFFVSGDLDVDGTTNLDVVDIDGAVDFASTTAHAGNATFADNAKAIFGAGSDLQIYHDGSHSRIDEQGTGVLFLQTNGTNIQLNKGTSENMLVANVDGSVDLYYDNSKKLATTSTGIDVTGAVTADGLDIEIDDNAASPVTMQQGSNSYFKIVTTNSSESVQLGNSTTNPDILLGGGNVGIGVTPEAWTVFNPVLQIGGGAIAGSTATNFRVFSNTYYDGSYKRIATGAVTQYEQADGLHIWYSNASGSADSTFTPDEHMRIDSSGQVGIGTSSPSDVLHAVGASINVERQSNGAGFGAGLKFSLGDSASTTANHNYASIFGVIEDNTNGAEDGYLSFQTSLSGSLGERMRIDSSGLLKIGTSGTVTPYSLSKFAIDTGTYAYMDLLSTGSSGINFGDAGGAQRGTIEYDHGSDFMRFGSAGAERMRIDSSGNLVVGKTSAADFNEEGITINGSVLGGTRAGGAVIQVNRITSDGNIAEFYRQGVIAGRVTVSSGAASYLSGSDYRLKDNIMPLTGATSRLMALKPSRFVFLTAPNITVDGFIAHEVSSVVPEAIDGEKDAVDEKGDPIYQGIDHGKMVPLLTAALQEAIANIEALTARIEALEGAN